jgi:hypothetical protein
MKQIKGKWYLRVKGKDLYIPWVIPFGDYKVKTNDGKTGFIRKAYLTKSKLSDPNFRVSDKNGKWLGVYTENEIEFL